MKFFKKNDVLIVLGLIIVGITIRLLFNNKYSDVDAKAEIYFGSELVETVDLTKGQERIFSVPQEEHVVFHLYPDGSIAFEKSDCPDKICIKSGRLNTVGETAACLPNKLILKLVPISKRGSDDIDMIIGG